MEDYKPNNKYSCYPKEAKAPEQIIEQVTKDEIVFILVVSISLLSSILAFFLS